MPNPTQPLHDKLLAEDEKLVAGLRCNARMIEGWAKQDERPTLTGFGLNLLYGHTTKAADRIEELTRNTAIADQLAEALLKAREFVPADAIRSHRQIDQALATYRESGKS